MTVKDIDITITRETMPLSQAGFGMPLVLGTSKAQEYKEYTDLDEVADDFQTEDPEYKFANAIFRQSPRPSQLAIRSIDHNHETDPASDLVDELNELVEKNNDWYFLLCTRQDNDAIEALSDWTAAYNKLYFATTDDSAIKTTTPGALGDLGSENTVLIWHAEDDTVAAGWVGKCAPQDPGSITWKFKTIGGASPAEVGTTEIGNLHDNNVNTYVSKMGVNQSSEGLTTAGEFVDVIRGQHWAEARIAERVQRLLTVSPKVPYDNRGISQVVSEVEGVMKQAVAREIIAVDEDGNGIFAVTAPNREDVDENTRANRILPDVYFEFELAGAVHKVEIQGVIKV